MSIGSSFNTAIFGCWILNFWLLRQPMHVKLNHHFFVSVCQGFLNRLFFAYDFQSYCVCSLGRTLKFLFFGIRVFLFLNFLRKSYDINSGWVVIFFQLLYCQCKSGKFCVFWLMLPLSLPHRFPKVASRGQLACKDFPSSNKFCQKKNVDQTCSH